MPRRNKHDRDNFSRVRFCARLLSGEKHRFSKLVLGVGGIGLLLPELAFGIVRRSCFNRAIEDEMRVTPKNLTDLLVADEGEVLHAYPDSEGYLTIGVGRLIDQRKGGRISQYESRILLANDILYKCKEPLAKLYPWTSSLSEARYAVVASMAFNMGIDGLSQFKRFLAAVQAGDYGSMQGPTGLPVGAVAEMLASKWAAQVGARSHRLALQMETDQWQ